MKDNGEDALNAITVTLQDRICSEFDLHYSKTIQRSLYFIQRAANAFIKLPDKCLLDFATAAEEHAPLSSQTDPVNGSEQLDDHLKWVKHRLDALKPANTEKKGMESPVCATSPTTTSTLEPAHVEKKGVKHLLTALHLGKRDTSISLDDYCALCNLIAQINPPPKPGCETSPHELTTIS